MFNVSDIRGWNTVGKSGFTAGWRPIYSSVPGLGNVGDELELVLPKVPDAIGGRSLVVDPSGDPITVKRTTWTGTEDSRFRVTMDKTTGALSGSMKFYVEGRRGAVLTKTCKVSGVVVDGTAYCSALSSGNGSYAVKVSSCDACED